MRLELLSWIALLLFAGTTAEDPCENGGFRPTGALKCNCPSFWGGDTCNERICINGGYNTTDRPNYCICPPGYNGLACEAVLAAPSPKERFDKKTSFNLIIFNSFTDYWGMNSMKKTIESIKTALGGLTKDYDYYNYLENEIDDYGLAGVDGHIGFKTKNPLFTSNQSLINYLQDPNQFKLIKTERYSCFTLDGFYKQIFDFIRDQNLQRTTITIVTQNPPSPSKNKEYEELVFLANAHQVKINLIMIQDSVFMRCNYQDEITSPIWSLTRHTNGHTALIQYDDSSYDTSLVTNLFDLQNGYELMTQDFSENCNETNTFTLDVDSAAKDFLLVIHASKVAVNGWTIDNPILRTVSPNWHVLSATFSTFRDVWIFSFNNLFNPDLDNITVTVSTDYEVPCSLKTYRRNLDQPIEMIPSFSVQSNVDSDQTGPKLGEQTYLTLHLETERDFSTATVEMVSMNSKKSDGNWTAVSNRTAATFEWISDSTFACVDATWNSLQLKITNDEETLYRTIPHMCYNFVDQTNQSPRIFDLKDLANCKTNALKSGTCFVDPKKITNTNLFVFGLSNTETDAFVIDPESQITNLTGQSSIKLMMWDRWTSLPIYNATSPADAQANLYGTYKLDKSQIIGEKDQTQLFDQLKLLSEEIKEEENGLIWLLLGDRLPTSNAFDDFKKQDAFRIFVNQGHRVFAFMDSNLTRNDDSAWDTNPINSLVGTTNGHFITIDRGSYGVQQSSFSNISTLILQNLVNRRLLLTGNFKDYSNVDFPSLVLHEKVTNLIITATPAMTKAGFLCPDPPVVIVGNDQNAFILKQQPNTNFFWTEREELPAGVYHMSRFGTCANAETHQPIGMHIRIWAEPIAVSVKYAHKDLAIVSNFSAPNTDEGFTARLAIPTDNQDGSTTVEVAILQCDGTATKWFGQTQRASSIDAPTDSSNCTNSYFYPYYCQATKLNGCPTDFEGIHYAQFFTNDSRGNIAHFTRPFVCRDTTNKVWDNCTTTDGNGNFVCGGGGTADKYYRGPTGGIIDCSNNGENYYNATVGTYQCCCGDEFTGNSCQKGKCLTPNIGGGAVDTNYRTFSVVFGYGKNSLFDFDKMKILPHAEIPGVWLYQAFIECAGSAVIPVYIGPDYDIFIKTLNAFKDYPEIKNEKFVLQRTLAQVTASFGTSPQRGLTLIYYYIDPTFYEPPSLASDKVSATLNDTDPAEIESLYRQLQLMNQQVLVFTNFDASPPLSYGTNDILAPAAFSTGGMSFMVTNDSDKAFADFTNFLNDAFYNNGPASPVYQKILGGGQSFLFNTYGKSTLAWSLIRTLQLSLYKGSCPDRSSDRTLSGVGSQSLDPGQYCFEANEDDAVVTIYSKDTDFGLATGFVQKWSDDIANAVATSTTALGPSLMVYLKDDYDFVNQDPSTRDSERSDCTYQKATYSLDNIKDTGYTTIQLDIVQKSENNQIVATRTIPFAVTESIVCQNDGTFNGNVGACDCPDSWAGIDCSIPQCVGGINGIWGTTCNCLGFADTCDKPWTTLQFATLC